MMITKRLLDVCDFQGGTQPPKNEWINDPREGYVRMLQIRDYSQGDAKFIQYVKDTKKLHKCKKDDIMLSRYGYIGQAFMGLEGAYNVALVKVIKKQEIHTPYLLYYFQSYYFQHFLLSNVGARATIPGFNKDELENALIRMPAMSEQIEIASKIAKVDELIGFYKQQLDVLDTLIKSRFIELFGDVKTGVYKFKTRKLGEVAVVGSSHRVFTTEFVENGVPFYRGTEIGELANGIKPENPYRITKEHYDRLASDETKPQIGDLLMPSICNKGQVWMVDTDEPFYYKDGRVLCISPNRKLFNCKYLEQFMREKMLVEYPKLGSGSTFAEFKIFLLKDIDVLIPPMELQNHFADFVHETDKSKFYIVQIQKTIELLIRAIQHKTKEVLL